MTTSSTGSRQSLARYFALAFGMSWVLWIAAALATIADARWLAATTDTMSPTAG